MNFRKQLGCDTFRTEEKGTRASLVQNALQRALNGAKTQLGTTLHCECSKWRLSTADPEEFITVLFQKVLCMEPLLKLR